MKLAFLLKICLLTSCTSTIYQASKFVNVYAGPKGSHIVKRSLIDINEFYIWGLLPKNHIVNIDHHAMRCGMSEFSVQKIEEYQTIGQYLYSIFSFGLYIPKSFKIVGYGIRHEK